MWKLEYDDRPLIRMLSELEKKQLPFATMQALNDSMFAVRDAWKNALPQVFEQPTPFTLNAVLFNKATKQNLVAEVFLRDELRDGTPPARYLETQAKGGARDEKPIEHLLRRAGVLGGDEFLVPARGFPTDAYGNIPGGIQNAILSDLQASRDPLNRSTAESRARRARKKDVSKRGVYFMSGGASGGRRSAHLPKAIFQRTAFGAGSSIRMVFIVVKSAPRYRKRFDGEALARATFAATFPDRFRERLRVAVLNARVR
jgi:hypothetical protein